MAAGVMPAFVRVVVVKVGDTERSVCARPIVETSGLLLGIIKEGR